jgi:hypothetical protein
MTSTQGISRPVYLDSRPCKGVAREPCDVWALKRRQVT